MTERDAPTPVIQGEGSQRRKLHAIGVVKITIMSTDALLQRPADPTTQAEQRSWSFLACLRQQLAIAGSRGFLEILKPASP
ncbi:MAG: hypothetical protein DCF18_07095 [Cyanobium sp.]|nr:MAG: hypothetical protein DCF18_07095 [Cyanobium sp.]